jgi:DNA-binding MarR family transcriptional regulator
MIEPMKMRLYPHPFAAIDHEKQQKFLEFIREVSPSADPKSVILFGQIMRAKNYLAQAAEKHLGSAGLSDAKFRLMVNLHRAESCGTQYMQPSELSEMQGISRNTASALIASLEKDGLIHRELDGTDHRKFLIHLTPEGRKLLKSHQKGHFEFITRCFEGFSATEREALLDLLTRLNKDLSRRV